MSKLKRLKQIGCIMLMMSALTQIIHAAQVQEKRGRDVNDQIQILNYVNAYRLKHHLSVLTLNPIISREAAKHSRDMANKVIPFGHTHFPARVKYLYKKIAHCRGAAENVAYYKLNAQKLVEAWIASPGHRRNIEGNYNLTGVGIAYSKKGWAYYTQMFVRADN